MLLIFFEKVLEAIYFALFLIFGKDLKHKRLILIISMIVEYLILKYFIKFNIWFQFFYIFGTYCILKILYKQKAQITDIFLISTASIILVALSIICYAIIFVTVKNYYVALILNRIVIFGFLFIFRNKIYLAYKEFYPLWNRHDNPRKIKSLSLRNSSIIIFNLMFWVVNFGMEYSKLLK